MSLEKIGHYSLTNPSSVYDEEALTALELAGRTAGKVNEAVGAFNKLEEETGDHLQAQDNRITKMNDETMPAKVTSEVQKQIDNGTFDAQINTSLNHLNERVDNLLGSVSTGSTTLDAEVIDMRVGYNGTTYSNSGEAIRTQVSDIYEDMASIDLTQTNFHVTGKNIIDAKAEGFIRDGYYDTSGNYQTSNEYKQSDFTKVKVGVKYTSNETGRFVLWYDKSKNMIGHTTSTDFKTQGYVTPPEGSYYARFVCTDVDNFIVCEGDDPTSVVYEPYYCYIPRKYVNMSGLEIEPKDTTFFDISRNLVNKNDPDVVIGGYYSVTNEYMENANYNMSGYIKVDENTTYFSSETMVFITLFDADKNFIKAIPSTENTTGVIKIPYGVTYVRIPCLASNWNTFQFEKGDTKTEFIPYKCAIKAEHLPIGLNYFDMSDIIFTSYGDSITARGGWQRYLVEKYGFSHVNLGIGSTTMQYVEGYEEDYPCMVNGNRIQAIKDSNADVITILGGANDVVRGKTIGTSDELTKPLSEKTLTSFYGALSYLVETLLTWKPTVKILLLTTFNSNNVSNNVFYKQCAEATREVAHYYALPLVDLEKESGLTYFNIENLTSDGVHPNEEGNKRIACMVASKLEEIFKIR